jgi:hypothetical protein
MTLGSSTLKNRKTSNEDEQNTTEFGYRNSDQAAKNGRKRKHN